MSADTLSADIARARVRPRAWVGVAAVIGYLALVWVLYKVLSPLAPAGSKTAGHELIVGTLSQALIALGLIVLTSALGWWGPAVYERERRGGWWGLIPAVLIALAIAAHLILTDWGAAAGGYAIAVLLTCLLVGFCEELTTRGVLLVALRSRFSEAWSWLITSALFAVMHAIGLLGGADAVSSATQILNAFFAASVFYLLRRFTGSIIWAMILHGVFDFSVEAHDMAPAAVLSSDSLALGVFFIDIVAFALAVVLIVKDRRRAQ